MSAEPKYVAQTLAWCNAWRKRQGKRHLTRLPKGNHSGWECPCGKATGLYVGTRGAWPKGTQDWIDLPDAVQKFVEAFDDGRLPQYEAKS